MREELVDLLGAANLRRYQLIIVIKELILARPAEPEQPSASDIKSAKSAAEGTFHDSGLGTSLPTASEAGSPVVSSAASSVADGRKARFPPLTPQAIAGQPFECDGCGKRLMIRNKNQWRYALCLIAPNRAGYATDGNLQKTSHTRPNAIYMHRARLCGDRTILNSPGVVGTHTGLPHPERHGQTPLLSSLLEANCRGANLSPTCQ